ncbi:MAG: energy-coupling factor ABC transporter ATP-binding protein [Promethearchaeota archaeon]
MTCTTITVKGLHFSYSDGKPVFSDISFQLEKGEIVAFLGTNGIGKTTMFYLFLKVLKPKKGQIFINEENIAKKNKDYIRDHLGFVFQDPNDQLFCPTVWEDIAFGPHNQGKTRDEVDAIVETVLDKLGIHFLKERKPHEMSHGEKKMAAIATILAINPHIFIFDEPLANLDGKSRNKIIKIIRELKEQGKTVIFSTQDALVASELADTVVLLKNASEVRVEPKENILRDITLLSDIGISTNPISDLFWQLSNEYGLELDDGKVPITIKEAKKLLKEKLGL